MKRYRYQARDKTGKIYKGVVEAQEERQAVKVIHERSLVPYKLEEEGKNIVSQITLSFNRRVKFSDLVMFTRQLSTMVTAGLQLTDALSLLRMQISLGFAEVVSDLLTAIEGGSSLAAAMERHPEVFSKVYVSLVRTGESAGLLDEILARLADNLEKEQDFKSKVRGAMIYPIIIIIGMGVVIAVMMVFVIPKMAELYKDFGAKLPMATQILIGFSETVAKFWWIFVFALVVIIYLFRIISATREGRIKISQFMLKLPVIGYLNQMIILTEFTRTMGLLIGAGVSIVESLIIISESMGNQLFEDAAKQASAQVEKGFPMAYALAETERFPPIVIQMVAVGEETGKVGDVLMKLSKYFESESDHLVKGLTTAIEPLIIIVLGLGVGFLVISIILPIYNLTSQFSG